MQAQPQLEIAFPSDLYIYISDYRPQEHRFYKLKTICNVLISNNTVQATMRTYTVYSWKITWVWYIYIYLVIIKKIHENALHQIKLEVSYPLLETSHTVCIKKITKILLFFVSHLLTSFFFLLHLFSCLFLSPLAVYAQVIHPKQLK